MWDGVVRGMELLPDEAEAAFAQIIVCREDVRNGTGFFDHTVRPLREIHRPDILWIDPAHLPLFMKFWLKPVDRRWAFSRSRVHNLTH